MGVYIKKYDDGFVKAVKVKDRFVWRCYVNEWETVEEKDADGKIVLDEHKQPRLKKVRHQRKAILKDVPCTERKDRSGKVYYEGVRKAEERFREWRQSLVDQAQAEYEKALEDQGRKEFSYDEMLVSDLMDGYIMECEERELEASTIVGYKKSCKHVKAFLGGMRLCDVTQSDLKAFERHMDIDMGVSATTRAKAIKIFKAAFDVHKEHISTYPFIGMREWMPRASKPSPNPLTEESVERVISDIESSDPSPFICAVGIALRTGMRQSEICGLKWSDCDFERNDIHVQRAIGRASGYHDVRGYAKDLYVKGPKDTNIRSRKKDDPTRHVPMSPKVRELLLHRRELVTRELLEADPNMSEADIERKLSSLYVCGSLQGRFYNPEILSREWRGYSRTLIGTKGRRPTFHHLRDTCASYMKNHTDFKTVSLILGHEDASFTMRYYADSTEKERVAAMEALDDVF